MREIKCPVCEKCPTECYTVCVDCYERVWDEIAESRQKIKTLECPIPELGKRADFCRCKFTDPLTDEIYRLRYHKIGMWLSAALEDDNVCEEMKEDIRDWFGDLTLEDIEREIEHNL